jgi:hypothetical protein
VVADAQLARLGFDCGHDRRKEMQLGVGQERPRRQQRHVEQRALKRGPHVGLGDAKHIAQQLASVCARRRCARVDNGAIVVVVVGIVFKRLFEQRLVDRRFQVGHRGAKQRFNEQTGHLSPISILSAKKSRHPFSE